MMFSRQYEITSLNEVVISSKVIALLAKVARFYTGPPHTKYIQKMVLNASFLNSLKG